MPAPTPPGAALPNPGARRPAWPRIAAVAVALVLLLAMLILLTSCSSTTAGIAMPAANVEVVPKPIARAELMSEYARIAPLDRTATPETVDRLAQTVCGLLDSGKTTDLLISTATEQYNANATAVVRLLVSYKCPHYLKEFK